MLLFYLCSNTSPPLGALLRRGSVVPATVAPPHLPLLGRVRGRVSSYRYILQETGLPSFPSPFVPEAQDQPGAGQDERNLWHQMVLDYNLDNPKDLQKFTAAWNERACSELGKKLDGKKHLRLNIKTQGHVADYHKYMTNLTSGARQLLEQDIAAAILAHRQNLESMPSLPRPAPMSLEATLPVPPPPSGLPPLPPFYHVTVPAQGGPVSFPVCPLPHHPSAPPSFPSTRPRPPPAPITPFMLAPQVPPPKARPTPQLTKQQCRGCWGPLKRHSKYGQHKSCPMKYCKCGRAVGEHDWSDTCLTPEVDSYFRTTMYRPSGR